MSILKAAYRKAVCTAAGAHAAIAAIEEEVASIGTTNTTTPIVAGAANEEQAARADDAEASRGKVEFGIVYGSVSSIRLII